MRYPTPQRQDPSMPEATDFFDGRGSPPGIDGPAPFELDQTPRSRRDPFWIRMTMPNESVNAFSSASQRERLRRARLLSILVLTFLIVLVALAPRGFFPVFDIGTTSGVAATFLIVLITGILNRFGKITTASVVFVLGITAAIAAAQVFTPDGTIGLQDISAFDLFAVPIIIAGILLPRSFSILLWLGCAIFTVVDLELLPHKQNLDDYIHLSNFSNVYPVAVLPILLSAIVAVISWVAAGSVQNAILEADRSVELERAYQFLADQKHNLEDAVAVLQAVHARVANGDLSVRAPTNGGELMPLAVSLNLMLERLSRSQTAESTLGGLEQSIYRLNQSLVELAQGRLGFTVPVNNMGRLTPIAAGLEQLRSGIAQVTNYSASLANQITNAAGELAQANRAMLQFLQQGITNPEIIAQANREFADRVLSAERDLMQLSDQLRQYLARFVV